MYRMGLLAVLRSQCKSATIGVMITASHNPEQDNGVKLVDPMGEMMEASWEILASELVNVSDDDLAVTLEKICSQEKIDVKRTASVFLGRDTRPSSPSLAQAVKDGVSALGGQLQDFGIVTTPQLHYVVVCKNTGGTYGDPTEMGYFTKLSSAFTKLRPQPANGNYVPTVKFDGANGVGALKMRSMMSHLKTSLYVQIFNEGSGRLNHKCGADFVKVSQCPPEGVTVTPLERWVSVDGDADRVVYFYLDDKKTFHLMDGDKIATLVAGYLQELVRDGGLQLNLGLVQTAYANGSSTKYITEQLNVPVACVSTGVKHLHHRAIDFDIGVYFEANGHGTVVFSQAATNAIRERKQSSSGSQKAALNQLAGLCDIINQTVGDAISDMLLVESILHARGWSIADWDRAYTDMPNRQMKVRVQDRTVIATTDAERRCVTPSSLQPEIDTLVKQYPSGRSFVRPSGTEDVIRVYAEAVSQESADNLAHQVALKVFQLAGGVGDLPQKLQ